MHRLDVVGGGEKRDFVAERAMKDNYKVVFMEDTGRR